MPAAQPPSAPSPACAPVAALQPLLGLVVSRRDASLPRQFGQWVAYKYGHPHCSEEQPAPALPHRSPAVPLGDVHTALGCALADSRLGVLGRAASQDGWLHS